MKIFIGNDGEIVEKPESLKDALQLKSPELAEKVDNIYRWKANLRAYMYFLYSYPTEQEWDLSERPQWEEYIQAINSQQGIQTALSSIDIFSRGQKDIRGDKVVVVHSDIPFCESIPLFKGFQKRGRAEGFVGLVDSYDITDTPTSRFFSLDGKVYQRFVLDHARKLSKKELSDFALGNLLYARHHHDTAQINASIEELTNSPLGNEHVVIYDKFPNIDYYILHHEAKEVETAVAHISEKDAERIDISGVYGPKQIPNSERILISSYKSPPRGNPIFIGIDDRKISEIYNEVRRGVESTDQQVREKVDHVFVAKRLKIPITEEQWGFIKSVPCSVENKWKRKFIDENGIEITNQTMVGATIFGSNNPEEIARKELGRVLEQKLSHLGYKPIDREITYGFGEDRPLALQTTYDLSPNKELYAGELVAK